MRKIYTLLLLLAVVACTDEYHYDAPSDSNNGIYFETLNNANELVFGPNDIQNIEITVFRHDAGTAATYKLATNDDIVLPSSVSFAVGEKKKTVVGTVALPIPTFRDSVTVSIAPEDCYTYGIPQTTFTLSAAMSVIDGKKSTYGNSWTEEDCTIYYFGKDNEGLDIYGAKDMLGEGYMLIFTLDADGHAIVLRQDALFDIPYIQGITESYLQQVEGEGTYDATQNRLSFTLRYYISGAHLYTITDEALIFAKA